MIFHRTETAATPRSYFVRRAAMIGVAAAAITGVVAGSALTANSPAHVPLPASAVTTAYHQAAGAPVTKAPATPQVTAIKPPTPVKPAKPATPVKKAPAPHKAVKVAAPPMATLLPHGVGGGQQNFPLSAKQRANAAAIVHAGQAMKLPPRAMVLAVQCSMQESTLHNYGNLGAANDHDSQGLFQQRPSSGWGTPAQVTNPTHAAQSFLHRLVQVPGWQHMPATLAIQAVQVSAFPQAYAKWEKFAASVVASTYAADAAHAAAAAAGK